MLIKITTRCSMGCSHCFDDALPDGDDMTLFIFGAALGWSRRVDPLPGVILGGGEPTEHPMVVDFIKLAAANNIAVMVCSNGSWMEDKQRAALYLELPCLWQITNDERYYPRKVKVIEHETVFYVPRIASEILPLGRSAGATTGKQSPSCFNLRSIARHFKSLPVAIMTLRQRCKMCTPCIGADGSIYPGESRLCASIGQVGDSDEAVLENLLNLNCNRCGLMDKLEKQHLKAIGLINPIGDPD